MPTEASLDLCRRTELRVFFGASPYVNALPSIGTHMCALVQNPSSREHQKQGVCHTMALAFTLKKSIFMAKEELCKFKYFFTMQKYIVQRNPLKETKILQDIITL
jgi:hypothetical protein